MANTRKWTRLLMDAMDDGMLDPRAVADMALGFMSEDDVFEMCEQNDLYMLDPESKDDE